MRIEMILLWLIGLGKVLEWTTGDGRTYQLSGNRQMSGGFERFFHENGHPTRRNAGMLEMQTAFEAAAEPILFYTIMHNDRNAERLTRNEIIARVQETVPGS
jgi:hypothetical protein